MFLGFGAAVAMGYQTLLFSTYFAEKSLHPYDLVFIIPEFIAAYAAVLVAGAVLTQEEGKGTATSKIPAAAGFFVLGLMVTVIAFYARSVVLGTP